MGHEGLVFVIADSVRSDFLCCNLRVTSSSNVRDYLAALSISLSILTVSRSIFIGKEQATSNPFPFNQSPMANNLPQPAHEIIFYPTIQESLRAVCNWHDVAVQFHLEYAFVGSIVAWLRAGRNLQINSIEILVKPTTLANGAQTLVDMKDQRTDILGITPANQFVVIVEGNRVIPLEFVATGSNTYPNDFIPPYNSPARNAGHLNLQPTFGNILLRYYPPYNRWIPYINCRHLLLQRLLRFNPHAGNNEQKRQNYRYITDIMVFLKCTAEDRDDPFPPAVAQMLLQTVIAFIHYAANNNVPYSIDARTEWRRLGIAL